MIRVTRAVTATLALLALAAASPGTAYAEPSPGSLARAGSPGVQGNEGELPEGWRLTGKGADRELVWTSPDPVPMGDARVEFHAGNRLLGIPVPAADGKAYRLRADGLRLGSGKDLKVVAGGRRLDADAPAQPSRARPPARSALTEAPFPANPVDPGVPGGYRTVSGEYDLKSVRLPGYAEPVEMRAVVVGPASAPGKRPLALFLHGRHATCYGAGEEVTGDWPCGPGTRPIPSHKGYLRAQQLLASQGYVTVSISANGINAQDHLAEDAGAQARSSLVRQHLARWAEWSENPAGAPSAVRAASPADLSRVLLVGHSRGGEGVNRAALDSLHRPPADQDGHQGPVRWTIRGNVLIGPTIFGQNPAPDVPSMTVLPGCDGDVSDLQGQIYVDGTRGVSRGAALQSSVYMPGANHNFFNSEWTPGQAEAPADDDFFADETTDPVCSPGTATRLTATQQQAAGATYIAAAAQLFVGGDDRVRPLLDGTGRRAPSAGPARVLSHAVGAHRTPAFLPGPSVAVTGGRVCAQIDPDPDRACLAPDASGRSPHFAHWEASPEPGRDAVAFRWKKGPVGPPVTVRTAVPVSLKGSEALALRVIVPPNSTGTRMDVTLVDASGRRARLGVAAKIDGLPGSDRTTSLWARELRVPLAAAARSGLDLSRVTTLELTPRGGSGSAWLMDAWGWRPGTPEARPAAMPRVDIGRTTVDEGDAGVRTYRVPVHVSGEGSGQVRVFVPRPGTDETTSRIVTVAPGSQSIDVPVEVRGNTRYGYDLTQDVSVKAVRGVAVGSHRGGVTVRNDDAMPTVTLTPVAADVTEGKPLTWRLTLSAVADVEVGGSIVLLPVAGGAELSTADVARGWLEENFGEVPAPPRPLSRIWEDPSFSAYVPAGRTSADVTVPTVADAVREPTETLRARLTTYDGIGEPHEGPEFTGTVRDAAPTRN
ncbi:hypothetical protein M5362_00550 [Streptomyces sp. Je 1-79]|uniref:hypothetical protein n=1 Tax=Streptomyces sp. Je 1-79 TaxID=2943847 RepID=UPI0021A52AD2|nr:hypothetical protein [Streptomyces sp. Je 1-79]MCT4351621.1 hypothetical protein [Streptomyces sp. Je 1-79]